MPTNPIDKGLTIDGEIIKEKINYKIILCLLEELWNFIKYGQSISGHTFVDFGYKKTGRKTTIYSVCERCGRIDFSWYFGKVFDSTIKGLKRL